MSYYGSWPIYKISNFRGTGELLWKVARLSWKVDRILLPLVLPGVGFLIFFNDKLPWTPREVENPYTEAYKKKKAEGKYTGVLIGIRPEKYF
jgi:hypothetical protein